jgi:hypothetical protein
MEPKGTVGGAGGTPETTTTKASAPTTEAPLVLSSVTAKWTKLPFGDNKGSYYLKVELRAKPTRPFEKAEFLKMKAECAVEGDVRVDTTSFLGGQLDILKVGQSKKLDSPAYFNDPFEKPPGACTLSFHTEHGLDEGPTFVQFCVRGGKAVDGGCQ